MIAIIGTGYVGLVQGACLADLGNDIICADIDKEKIEMLKRGEMPFYEPGLGDLVKINSEQNRLTFTADVALAIKSADIIFVCVGTPPKENNEADLRYVYAVAKTIGENMNRYKIIVTKSTVPVGTSDEIEAIIKDNQTSPCDFDVVSNPEFLREGASIKDFRNPDRIVIGGSSKEAMEKVGRLYKGVERTDKPIIYTDIKSSELIKYAANAMLSTRISFMNMLSRLCEKMGSDIKQVGKGIGFDTRIGSRFLQAGVGYGGSCFPKDVLELIHTLKKHGCDASILEGVDKINQEQRKLVCPKVKKLVGDLKDKKIAIWGLSFKPRTDDMRMAPSIDIIKDLVAEGAKISAHDPIAAENARKIISGIEFCKDPYETAVDSDCIVLVTEWDVFRHLDFKKVKSKMREANMVDGRNIYSRKDMIALGFGYAGVGR